MLDNSSKLIESVENVVENTVHIVKPDRIDIQIKEFTQGCWEDGQIHNLFERSNNKQEDEFENTLTLIKDKEYYIRVVMYDSDMNQIHIGPNVAINVIHFSSLFSLFSFSCELCLMLIVQLG